MALLVLNGKYAVIGGTIAFPRVGAWHADLLIDTEDDLTGAAKIAVGDSLELAGTVDRAIRYLGTTQLRLVGGGGGLRHAATPKFYKRATVREVLRDLAKDGGETVSSEITDAISSHQFNGWTSVRTSIGRLVAELVRPIDGCAWRVLSDGTLWVGTETWPKTEITDWREIGYDHANGVIEIGLDAPTLLPGTTIGGFKVDRVEYRITGEAIQATAWEFREGEGGRIDHDMLSVARGSVRPFDFLALYAGKMTRQLAQTFDVAPDDERLPGMTGLPIRNGIPGLEMTVTPGAMMLVGWRNGDPREPFCALWGGGEDVTKVVLSARQIMLGSDTLVALVDGVVRGECIDPFSGATHAALGGASAVVMAKKLPA